MKRSFGNPIDNRVLDIDFTDLSFTGPNGTYEELSVYRLFIGLFVDVPDAGWRELPTGFSYHNNSVYGFAWHINQQDDKVFLQMVTADLYPNVKKDFYCTNFTRKHEPLYCSDIDQFVEVNDNQGEQI
ncbi:hypothetical protein P9112_005942 [Eukaryota sp. TZLM1-RC]